MHQSAAPVLVRKGTPRARALVALRRWLDEGTLEAGQPMPSERDLCQQFGVSLTTLHRAVKALEVEGRLQHLGGRTRIVADPRTRQTKLLQNTVAVLAQSRKPRMGHRMIGWSEFVSIGAFDAIEAAGLHALAFHPQRCASSDMDDLIGARPMGAVIPEGAGEGSVGAGLINRLQAAGIALSVFGDSPNASSHDRVVSDHVRGASETCAWMISHGRRRILQVLPPKSEYWVSMRREGYRATMLAAGLQLLPPLIMADIALQDQTTAASTRELFDAQVAHAVGLLLPHFKGTEPIDAILAQTDGTIATIAAACKVLGKKPNVDVYLGGYDHYWKDAWEFQYEATPPAVTADRNNPELGQELVKLLLDRVQGRITGSSQRRLVAPTLVAVEGAIPA